MTKIINWTKRATNDLEKITKFNIKLYSSKKAFEISKKLLKLPKILLNPEIDISEFGQIDETFNHFEKKYRKIIHKHCKITYRIEKNNIHIVRVFDTRQNPNKNK